VTVAVTDVTGKGSEQFVRLFREQYRLIYRAAYCILGNSEDAEDVLENSRDKSGLSASGSLCRSGIFMWEGDAAGSDFYVGG